MDYPAGRPQRRQGHEQGNRGLLRKTTKPHAQRRGEDNALTQGGDTEEGGPRARHTQSSAERTRRPICALTTRTGKHRGASTMPHLRGHMCRACVHVHIWAQLYVPKTSVGTRGHSTRAVARVRRQAYPAGDTKPGLPPALSPSRSFSVSVITSLSLSLPVSSSPSLLPWLPSTPSPGFLSLLPLPPSYQSQAHLTHVVMQRIPEGIRSRWQDKPRYLLGH